MAETVTTEELHTADLVIIAIYFIVVLLVGLWSTFRGSRTNTAGYFLAGKDMHWIPVGASTLASNIGAPMFIGLAGSAAAGGIAVTIFEWHAVFMLLALGWIFVPVYIASGAYTMPEYLKLRFGGTRLRIYLSFLGVILYILTKISGEMYAGALFIQKILGWDIYLSVVLVLAITGIYTVVGGLTAVIYTDTLQTVVLLIGSLILSIIAFGKVDGFSAMFEKYMKAEANYTRAWGNLTCGEPRADSLHIFRNLDADLPWPGTVFGLTMIALWVWCADQVMVQRSLSAKNMTHAKAGTVLAAYGKLLPFFLFITPGMISRILYPNDIACAIPEECERICDNPAGCSNIAYPLLVLREMPAGLRGLMLAALMAALMSSLTSIFNSASSMFTIDIWQRFRRHATQTELMVVGRVFVLVLIGVSIVWIPIMRVSGGGQLWNYLQAISAYIAPPWTVCFLLAFFWPRMTEPAAFWGLIIGFVVGLIRLALDFSYPAPYCGSSDPDNRPPILKDMHFLHFAILLSIITALVMVVISLRTKPIPVERLHKVTWWTRHDTERQIIESDDEEEVDDEESTSESHTDEKLTVKDKILQWMCGINARPPPKLSSEQKEEIRIHMTDISENPKWKRILNINAIICLSVTVFLLAFFG